VDLSGHNEYMVGLILIGLVHVALYFRRKYFPYAVQTPTGICHATCKPVEVSR